MSSVHEGDKLAKIQDWLCSYLDVKEAPEFEINDETVEALFQMMTQNQVKMNQQEILRDQIMKETKEYTAESQRIGSILKELELDMTRDLSPKSQKLLKSLGKAADALECARPSTAAMTVALVELADQLNLAQSEVTSLERICALLMEKYKETKELKLKVEKQFGELETKLPEEKRNVETLKKSCKFHALKKSDYDRKILDAEEKLKGCGFSSNLTHGALVTLGEKAGALDAKLKPYRMQLESYRSLPADLNLARLKLHEALDELKGIEEELHDVFQNLR